MDDRCAQQASLGWAERGLAGSLVLSHVNDGGFWLVKEYFGMDIPQTLKTWTVVETGIAVMSITLILIANAVVA